MKRGFIVVPASVLFIGLFAGTLLAAQRPDSARSQERLAREVRHELVMLRFYNVFDNLEYRVDGDVVTLQGQVTRPTLKTDAERAVIRIEGVGEVVNNIEVLPPSPADDRIRVAVYRALFSQDSSLFRYGMGVVSPIRIVVKNGHVTLLGVVNSEADKNVATLRAKTVWGTFSVTNNLSIQKG
jgi:osmotically-inducible protein OsmY